MPKRKVVLIIMDGWGLGAVPAADAIQSAHTPFVDSLYGQYPHTTVVTCGEAVGLPAGQMGNSEVGHLNLGAGRVVYQELQRINVAIREGFLATNKALLRTIYYCLEQKKPLHLIGLVSDGGVHSHINHLIALLRICQSKGLTEVYVHAFTDGRDTDPRGGLGYLTTLQAAMQGSTGVIASITGRYYAMDRDNRWERVALAWKGMVLGEGERTTDPLAAVQAAYDAGITDEFIKPIILTNGDGQPKATIADGDAVLMFNFRTDRPREITKALTQTDFPEWGMHKLRLQYATMTEYDATFEGVDVLFETDNLNNTLGEVLSTNGCTQVRAAETEKYPHVTFFFSGGREQPFIGEQRIMASSPKVATYDLQPEMSAAELASSLVPVFREGSVDFVCVNFANADMVGHTGVWEAVVKAVETVDECVRKVVETALASGYTILLTADHGNADFMVNADGSPNTAHTLNPVPLFLIDRDLRIPLAPGKLGDIAPTILELMGLPVPVEMTGVSLLERPLL